MSKAFRVIGDRNHERRLVITCEHASNNLPEGTFHEADDLPWLNTHWGWDPGAAAVCEELVKIKECVAVLSTVSRLVCDLNRHIMEPDWVREEVEGYKLAFNRGVTESERERRRFNYHEPFHEEVDACLNERLGRGGDVVLLSLHSFTADYMGKQRSLEMGVLFDHFDAVAERFAGHLREQGWLTELNEPYSGKDGCIYSASRHGSRYGVIYLELEIRNDLIDTPEKVLDVSERLAAAISALTIRDQPRSELATQPPAPSVSETPTSV